MKIEIVDSWSVWPDTSRQIFKWKDGMAIVSVCGNDAVHIDCESIIPKQVYNKINEYIQSKM